MGGFIRLYQWLRIPVETEQLQENVLPAGIPGKAFFFTAGHRME